ncbi:sigma-70 family RNA polymerase sigma factor [Verrucomicrobiaceae bacterium 227]
MGNEQTSEMEHVQKVQGLFVKHSPQLRGYIASLVPRRSEVDDIVQEVFLVVTAKAGGFEWGTNFLAWAMTISRFKVMEYFRAGKKKEMLLGEEVVELLVQEAPEVGVDEGKVDALRSCLKRLSPRVQRMLADRYDGEMKPEKIAENSGWKASSVYVTLSRARTTLRVCIQRQLKGGTA